MRKNTKTIINKVNTKNEDHYEKYEKGSTRVLIPPEPREMLEKLRKLSGTSYQTLIDLAIQQLYERVITEGKISFHIERIVTLDVTKCK